MHHDRPVHPRQIRALDALNRRLIHRVSALIDELSQGARLMHASHWAHRGTTPRGWAVVTILG